MSVVLEARGLSVEQDGKRLLDGVDLALDRGETLTIIGPNGAGKSTLLRCLLGLQAGVSGQVLCTGRDLAELDAGARGRFAAYVPQSLTHVPPLTVRETVALGRYPHQGAFGPERAVDRARVDEVMGACGLEPFAARAIGTLSGGERQKVLLAAALVQDPQVLLLDEPTTGLDPGFQLELVGLLRSWRASGGALVVVSHELHLAGALGGAMLALRAGRVVDRGAVVELLHPERLRAVYDAELVVAALGASQTAVIPAFPASE